MKQLLDSARQVRRRLLWSCSVFLYAGAAMAGDLAFSDPAHTLKPPPAAVGFARRAPDLDVLPGFQKPPPGFGIVPFYWWLGDPLTKERLGWELEQMAGMGVSGYQINYAHSDKGGRSYGLTYPSEPKLFSEDWWNLTGWFLREARKQGAGISLSDYTLGFGQGWFVDDLLREHPEARGMQLVMDKDGKISPETVTWSLNPMHPMSGKWYAEKFFGQFEKHFPGEGGKGLNFFFSDELGFGVGGRLWSSQFAEEFKRRKGYDITPELPALFKDIGPRTPKIRLDYNDVLVALSEEGFFKPVFEWHQQRGMIMGCDHGGRGRDVVEFGDYFRTQRWNQGPGADQPGLGKDIIKAKVAASIAHLYERPRVWLEGFYGSGWGTTPAGVVDATLANFTMGFNLLGLHGMYYSTHGGWWEWAPPDNTFRMPYWRHLQGFMDCVQRLSYLLSQGHHRCDVAILYPVAPVEAGMDGAEAVKTAFSTGEQLYRKAVDFDFMDFESLARAKVVGKELHVSGETYRTLVLPAMKAVRYSTMEKALEFHRAGGVVVAPGALPEASDRIGREDPQLAAMVKEMFPSGPANDVFAALGDRDYDGPGYIQHRKVGSRDLYVVYDAPEGTECAFRATGKVELWNPWTGESRPVAVVSQTEQSTKLRLPLTEKEIQLIVFSPGRPSMDAGTQDKPVTSAVLDGNWEFEIYPILDNRFGDFHWPPTSNRIGVEVRQLWYCEGENTNGVWSKTTCTFGPQFVQSATIPPASGSHRYEFSWRWGIPGDPGHQGYHGLKGTVHDDLIGLGKAKTNGAYLPTVISYGPSEGSTFFSSAIIAPRAMTAYPLTGAIKPAQVRLNGQIVNGPTLALNAGANPLVLEYTNAGRTYFVASTEDRTSPAENQTAGSRDLTTSWWKNGTVLPFDVRAGDPNPVGWYRFVSPPGLRALHLRSHGKVQAWSDGKALKASTDGQFIVPEPVARPVTVLLKVQQERGFYAGAAFDEPIRLQCGRGQMALGDWAENESLVSYSGGAWYRKTVTLQEPDGRRVWLNLGSVAASAEIRINGQLAGVKVAPPWSADITQFVKSGENRIEVLICNTLANHYTTVPTGYRGSTVSGLLGPVRLEIRSAN
jgi:hypothetical protein